MLKVWAGAGGVCELEHAVFDVNGTLTRDGQVVDGVIERMHTLRQLLKVHLLTADPYGTQEKIINVALAVDRDPKIEWKILKEEDGSEDKQKKEHVKALGPDRVAAVATGGTTSSCSRRRSLASR